MNGYHDIVCSHVYTDIALVKRHCSIYSTSCVDDTVPKQNVEIKVVLVNSSSPTPCGKNLKSAV